MWRTGEEGFRDADDRLRSLFVLAAVVNAGADEEEEKRHTGGVGRSSLEPSIKRGGEYRFTADRSECSLARCEKGSTW